MLHTENAALRELLLKGNFGLEKESLRVTRDGFFAHTPHPFSGDAHIVRDFCENQTEINTPVLPSAREAVGALGGYTRKMQEELSALPEPEYLWPFSNPPYIRDEEDIPIAMFAGEEQEKTAYRNYLAGRYGRYKMTLSGIHVNYSFSDELLRADFALSRQADYTEYKNQFYVVLAEKAAAYGWVLTAATAASPLMDSSFVEKGRFGEDEFNGMASVRCSEFGYWNFFAPLFDYRDIRAYADSIQAYVDEGLLAYPSELYYPVRLKPPGKNSLTALREKGVDHIELRMFDLNPLAPAGVDERDILFAQLFLIWLAATPRQPFDRKAQVQAVQNFKNAAHYDLKTVNIVMPDGQVYSAVDAALRVLDAMEDFYRHFPPMVLGVLHFQRAKFLDAQRRYAWKIRTQFQGGFVEKGLEFIRQQERRDHHDTE